MPTSETQIRKSSNAMARVSISKTHSPKPGVLLVNHTMSAKGKGEVK